MRSFAILSLALLSFAGSGARATLKGLGAYDDGQYFRPAGSSECRSRFGVPTPSESYCETGIKAASRPKIKGSGGFAACAAETAVDMLDGDQSPIHFLANGTVMVEDRHPKVITTIKGQYETYNINEPARKSDGVDMGATERDVFVTKDANGRIVKIKSVSYTRKPNGPGLDKENPITWVGTYSYPAPDHNCQIDRLETDMLSSKKGKLVVQYSSDLCASVLHIIGQRKATDVMSRSDLVQQIQGAIHDSSLELRENENGKQLQYQENIKGQVPVLMRACRDSGMPVNLEPRFDLGSPAAKRPGTKGSSSSSL